MITVEQQLILTPDIRVLSIRQPWAWLIMHGGKDIENRTWTTKIRGRVFIHASKGVVKSEWEEAWNFVNKISPGIWQKGKLEIKPGTIERGGIIGSVEIVNCVRKSESPWFVGTHGFMLRNPQPAPFYPYKGQLGFFSIRKE